MPPLPVVKHLEVLEDGGPGVGPVAQSVVYTSSIFSVEKKLSTTALSQQLPRRLMLPTRPCASKSAW